MDSDAPPAVSALRSKFEKLARDTSPAASTSTKLETHDLLSLQQPRPRALSGSDADADITLNGVHLRPSSSSSDLKSGRRPPPPPPPSRASKPPNGTPPFPFRPPPTTHASAPTPSALHSLDRSTLIARKPPPLPGPSSHADGSQEIGSPSSGVGSLRSRFAGIASPSYPSLRPVSNGKRVTSHPIRFPTSPTVITDVPGHQARHSISACPPESPLIQLHDSPFDEETNRAPPLPLRPGSRQTDLGDPTSTDTVNEFGENNQEYPYGRASSDSDRSSDQSITPPPAHPSRPSSSLYSAQKQLFSQSSISSSGSESRMVSSPEMLPRDSSSSTPTLQVPPPLPLRRSPPILLKDLPDARHIAASAPPSLDRKAVASPRIAPPPTRTIALGDKLPPARRPISGTGDGSTSDSAGEDDDSSVKGRSIDTLPDASNSSRRPPIPPNPAFQHSRPVLAAHTSIIAVCGSFVIVAHHHIKIYDLAVSDQPLYSLDLREIGIEWRAKEPRVTSMEFRASENEEDRGRYLWIGTRDGFLWEIDVRTGVSMSVRPSSHGYPVAHIFRHGRQMITLDENGKLLLFSAESESLDTLLAEGQPKVIRVADKQGFVKLMGGLLWMSGGPGTGTSSAPNSHHTALLPRGPAIRVYDIFSTASSLPFKTFLPPEHLGAVTSGTLLHSCPNVVFLGHEGGVISLWDLSSEDGLPACVEIVKISTSDVLCLEGVNDRLWVGGRKGSVSVYDVDNKPWILKNSWNAHNELPVQRLFVDPWSIEKCGQLTVVSTGRDDQAKFWDGLLGAEWIDGELLKREASFSAYRPLNVLIISWNVDAAKPDALTGSADNVNFLATALNSVESPDIIAFGFQELIDLESRKMAAKTVLLGSKKRTAEGTLSEKVSRSYKLWHDRLVLAVRLAMPPDCPYTVVHTESLVGLFSCIFIKSDVRNSVSDVSVATVKRGIGGRFGNKGGIVARLVVDNSSICFINCHLAAGQHHTRARNADVAGILEEKEVFPATNDEPFSYAGGGDGSMVLDHEIVFLNGDLNYRIDQRRETVVAAVRANHLDSLLANDQLYKEMKSNKGFRLRSFVEAPITFAPTYKYDRRSSEYDSSEKSRIPAWCDRILYHSRHPSRVENLHYRRYEANISDHRPISAAFHITVKSVDRDARETVKQDIHGQWEVQQHVLLCAAQEFYASQQLL